tara:strand:+ start:2767 stop:2967 length:201 start_codon:yes stop_codon:yes gene_type:complete
MDIQIGTYKTVCGNEMRITHEEGVFSPMPWDFTGEIFIDGEKYYCHYNTNGTQHSRDARKFKIKDK